MSNRLNMAEHQAILGLARLNWSYRRIAAELGVDRETVARHVKAAMNQAPSAAPSDSNAAISITGPTVLVPADRESAEDQPPGADSNATIVITGSAEDPSPAADSNAAIVIAGSTALASRHRGVRADARHGGRSSLRAWSGD